MHTQILILGGGITGLSAAYHLEKLGYTDYLVIEKEPTPGGLCASQTRGGFTFDQSGHLLHLHTPYVKKLVKNLLGSNLSKLPREAYIYTQDAQIPFPFQANLFAAPPAVREACLNGLRKSAALKPAVPTNFKEWCLQAFGEGIYRYFMKPYNEKLWQTPPQALTWDWCGPFVPRPDLKQIEKGAKTPPAKRYGYNTEFYYPKKGGCGALTDALAERVPNMWLNAAVEKIDLKKKTVTVNGKTLSYHKLVNTLPLNSFLQMAGQKALAQKLAHTTVHVWNFAVNRKIKPFSWIYLPDEQDLCYRIGMQSSFSAANAPKGVSSFYVETAAPLRDLQQAQRQILSALQQKGIINKKDKILVSFWQQIPVAYAIYNKIRGNTVAKALELLEKRDCLCAGRYGRWEYSFMERCVLQGKETAQKLV